MQGEDENIKRGEGSCLRETVTEGTIQGETAKGRSERVGKGKGGRRREKGERTVDGGWRWRRRAVVVGMMCGVCDVEEINEKRLDEAWQNPNLMIVRV